MNKQRKDVEYFSVENANFSNKSAKKTENGPNYADNTYEKKTSKNHAAKGNNKNSSQTNAGSNLSKTGKRKIEKSLEKRGATVRPRFAASRKKEIANKFPVKIIPLGGMREIGKNMTCYEYNNDMIIVDCGIAFPAENMPGVDAIIPDFTYIRENLKKLRGIFITHGHEDHIGGLPWLLQEFKVPVYATPMTMKLIEMKLEDKYRQEGAKMLKATYVKPGDTIKAGVFNVKFIHVNHSIADAAALAIETPQGVIYHSGDFKVDYTPTSGVPTDLTTIAEIGNKGVLAMICESTNAELPGHSMSEADVSNTFREIFASTKGRIIVATFSSNILRLQEVINRAEDNERKVCILGRSMVNVFNAANELGYLKYKPDTIIDVNEIKNYQPQKLVLLMTGSQGEPMSALTRLAFSEHRDVEIMEGDTVILSSSMIPGNERAIYNVIDALFRNGANVIYQSLADVHASGHAYRDEIKLLTALLKPKFYIPAHGEYRMLYRNAEMANAAGVPKDNIAILANGDILELTQSSLNFSGYTEGAGVLIDGSGMGDIDEFVLRDRLLLADDGVVTVFVAVDGKRNALLTGPEIQARGFIYASEINHLVERCRDVIANYVKGLQGKGLHIANAFSTKDLRNKISQDLFAFTKRRPMVIVSYVVV